MDFVSKILEIANRLILKELLESKILFKNMFAVKKVAAKN